VTCSAGWECTLDTARQISSGYTWRRVAVYGVTYAAAVSACSGLSGTWVLPTAEAVSSVSVDGSIQDLVLFPDTKTNALYWESTVYSWTNPGNHMAYSTGGTAQQPSTTVLAVRCMKGP
jgi:hypothetical protein